MVALSLVTVIYAIDLCGHHPHTVTYVMKLPPGSNEMSMVKSLNILKKRIIIFV